MGFFFASSRFNIHLTYTFSHTIVHLFTGITSRLDHLVDLSVDALWLGPVFRSPMKDFGYDISDYTDIDPVFGTMQDFEELVDTAHSKGKGPFTLSE